MGRNGNCPVCEESYGMMQPGPERTVYYHRDLVGDKLYCVEMCDGETRERVESSDPPLV